MLARAVEGRDTAEDIALARRYVLIVAGQTAETRLTGTVGIVDEQDGEDATDIVDAFLAHSTEEADTYLNGAWDEAVALRNLPENWAAVEALAAALVERRRLAYAEACAVIGSAMLDAGALPRRNGA
jgi:hypothetical protein